MTPKSLESKCISRVMKTHATFRTALRLTGRPAVPACFPGVRPPGPVRRDALLTVDQPSRLVANKGFPKLDRDRTY
jgi:hypothetical protein